MSYMLFDPTRDYTDENGNPCTFGEHLAYVRDYMGTPDMWDSFETKAEAQRAADQEQFPLMIISENHGHRPVGKNRLA